VTGLTAGDAAALGDGAAGFGAGAVVGWAAVGAVVGAVVGAAGAADWQALSASMNSALVRRSAALVVRIAMCSSLRAADLRRP
jgi:hypothetical protein